MNDNAPIKDFIELLAKALTSFFADFAKHKKAPTQNTLQSPATLPSQPYLQEDWELYGKFGHHTGVDYGGRKKTGLPLFACADGELVYREVADSAWGKFLGHHAAMYVPSVGKSFLYCHMADEPRVLGYESDNADKLLQYYIVRYTDSEDLPTGRRIFVPTNSNISRYV